jgi:hypothetical protein
VTDGLVTLTSSRQTITTPVPAISPSRSAVLDGVKGLLVLTMVLYHWLNYFVTREGEIYRYLRFVTPSFIFITGFLITSIYLPKYLIGSREVTGRLVTRGVKLVAMFVALNLVAALVRHEASEGLAAAAGTFVTKAPAMFFAADGRAAVFEVLAPIGYLLVLAPVLLLGCAFHRHFLVAASVAGIGGLYLLKAADHGSATVELLTLGLLGMLIGRRLTVATIDAAVGRPAPWLGAYAVHLVLLTAFDVVYELQVVALVLNLVLFYLTAKALGARGMVAARIITLGQYSLLAYVAQIALLQVLVRAFRPFAAGPALYSGSLAATVVLTCLTIEVTAALRARSSLVDRMYRLAFA